MPTAITGKRVSYRPNRRCLHRKESSAGCNREDAHCSPTRNLTTLATQPRRNHHHPELALFSSGLSFKTTPPNFPFHHKSNVSLLCWAHLQFASSLQVLNCNSLLFPGKPILGGKVTDSFSFKVNNPKQVKPFKEISVIAAQEPA